MAVDKTGSRTLKSRQERTAIASPLRLEILGLFVSRDPMSIAEMATLMNRSPGSLYHHVRILEQAGILKQAGTRLKGKRHEALYLPTARGFVFDTSTGGEEAINSAVKLMATNFRAAERDLEASLRSDQGEEEFYAYRLHFRASPERLAEINEHLNAVLALISPSERTAAEFGPDDQHVALTLALLPIKGRSAEHPEQPGK